MSKGSSLLILLSVTTLLFSITTFAQTTFTNVARDAGLLEVKRYLSLGVAWGDYDNDGDLDLYVAHGDWAGWKMEADVLYRNNGNSNHWLHIKATGTRSNRNGVGARVTVRAGQLSMVREINGGCARAQHSLTANPETWIPYQLAQSADVTIRIYTESGRLVRTLNPGSKEEGMYLEKSRAEHWNGKNGAGEPVASGVYFYRLEAGDFSQARKMTVLK